MGVWILFVFLNLNGPTIQTGRAQFESEATCRKAGEAFIAQHTVGAGYICMHQDE